MRLLPLLLALGLPGILAAQTVTLDTSTDGRQQTIDGFGTCIYNADPAQTWWQNLYYDDLGASILRLDLVPRYQSPYSDFTYNSPWFHNSPALPGPEGNNVRTYTGAADYSRLYAGRRAPIAVMGPDIDANIALFDFTGHHANAGGQAAAAGLARRSQLGDFKLIGSIWSPAPWLKVSSGNTISGQSGIFPANGTPFPFIWFDNFTGGKLDVSGTPRTEFDDSALGGTGPTSALTQFARTTAAYVRGIQNLHGVRFYAISIQNELNFETFYNSCTYPLTSMYLAAAKAVRAEFDKYDDLRGILIKGPEDLLGGDIWGMWQYGGGATAIHKNLQLLKNIEADPVGSAAIAFYCVHGYAPDGVSSAGANPTQWQWWAQGWTTSPTGGIPANIPGFTSYGKKSWMTETSGEATAWLSPSSGYPGGGAWSIAVKMHQALTVGRQSAWLYWQFTDGGSVGDSTLTDASALATAPKYNAFKHFAKFVRPNSVRVNATVSGSSNLLATAYTHAADRSLTWVLINTGSSALTATLPLPSSHADITSLSAYTSRNGSYWQTSSRTVSAGNATVSVPGYGVVTLQGLRPSLSYASWQGQQSWPQGADTTGNGDPDRDGLNNLLEYFGATSPTLPQAGPFLASRMEGATDLVLGFTRREARTGVTHRYETSNDLGSWTLATDIVETVVATSPDGSIESVEARLPIPGERRFLRLVVE